MFEHPRASKIQKYKGNVVTSLSCNIPRYLGSPWNVKCLAKPERTTKMEREGEGERGEGGGGKREGERGTDAGRERGDRERGGTERGGAERGGERGKRESGGEYFVFKKHS